MVVDVAIRRDDMSVITSMQVKTLRFGELISEDVTILINDLGDLSQLLFFTQTHASLIDPCLVATPSRYT